MEENESRKSASASQETHASTILQHNTMQLCTWNQRPQIMRLKTIVSYCLHYAVLDRMAYQGLIIDVHWRVNGSSLHPAEIDPPPKLVCLASEVSSMHELPSSPAGDTPPDLHHTEALHRSWAVRLGCLHKFQPQKHKNVPVHVACSKLELLDWQVDWAGWTIIFAWDKRARMVTSCLHDPQNFWIISTAVSESRPS